MYIVYIFIFYFCILNWGFIFLFFISKIIKEKNITFEFFKKLPLPENVNVFFHKIINNYFIMLEKNANYWIIIAIIFLIIFNVVSINSFYDLLAYISKFS